MKRWIVSFFAREFKLPLQTALVGVALFADARWQWIGSLGSRPNTDAWRAKRRRILAPIFGRPRLRIICFARPRPERSTCTTAIRSEEHTSELQSLRHLVC